MKNAYSCNANVTIYRVFSCSYQKKILKLIEKKRKKEGERKKERKKEREKERKKLSKQEIMHLCFPWFVFELLQNAPFCERVDA